MSLIKKVPVTKQSREVSSRFVEKKNTGLDEHEQVSRQEKEEKHQDSSLVVNSINEPVVNSLRLRTFNRQKSTKPSAEKSIHRCAFETSKSSAITFTICVASYLGEEATRVNHLNQRDQLPSVLQQWQSCKNW